MAVNGALKVDRGAGAGWRPKNVLPVLLDLRRQDRERGQRISPETYDQQQFVRRWPAWRQF